MFYRRMVVFLPLLLVSVALTAAVQAEDSSRTFKVAHSLVTVRFIDQFKLADQKKIVYWLQQHAQAVTTLYGELPIPNVRVSVEKATGAGEPVPWGQVIREREERVLFRVNPEFSQAEFVSDWTAAHEFSHLFIPFPGNRDSWFSEGLATYLQNTLRVRAGMLTEQQGWQKLYEGLRRGQRDTRMQAMSLQQLSPKMHDSHSYQRVYWSGVCYFLQTEIDLFDATNGKHSLDSVLREFRRCCRFSEQAWTAAEIAMKFDEISATTVFTQNLRKIQASHALPDIGPLFAALGVRVTPSDRVVVSDKNNVLRHRIMSKTPVSEH